MITSLAYKERGEKKDAFNIDDMRLLYSSRAERLKIIKKLQIGKKGNKYKSLERDAKQKVSNKIKILVQLPQFETDNSDSYGNFELPRIYKSPNSRSSCKQNHRIIFQSDFEKTYKNRPKLTTPSKKLSLGIF